MRKQEALAALRRLKPELDALAVSRIGVFGSTARDTARPDSDLDVLVEFREGASYFRLAEIEQLLAERFGRAIDIFTEGSVHPLLRDRILSETAYA